MQRALRVALVSERRAEQRENAVAGRLGNVALVATHRGHHELQHRIDDRPCLLGIEIAHQLRRALDVGEQRRYRLALAVQGCVGGIIHLNGELDVSLRLLAARAFRSRIGCTSGERTATIAAKLLARLVRCSASGALRCERRATLGAEFARLSIFSCALRAAHQHLPY
jgi:hypothetical protein